MLGFSASNAAARIKALDRSQAVIEFAPSGEIISANERLLSVVGYSLDEIKGRPHSIFVAPAEADSAAYRMFWGNLRKGEFFAGEFRRVAKGGREIWIHGTYNPLIGRNGKVTSVVKYCTDITAAKKKASEDAAQIAAINRSQAVIHFTIDGKIVHANENFRVATGYQLEEIVGRHHSMFVEEETKRSKAYEQFWKDLGHGAYQAGEFKRVGKGGRAIWLQATYNPIIDGLGRQIGVIKFASDVTLDVEKRLKRATVQAEIDEDLNEIGARVSQATGQASSAVEAASQSTANVKIVAASAEELASSAAKISSQLDFALNVADEAVVAAERAQTSAHGLSQAASEIDAVTGLIRKIAGQTALLALNATIEAAAAGEAGRSFAVVAAEVKALSEQTSQATNQISRNILTLQTSAKDVVVSIQGVAETITKIHSSSSTISSAVDEQSAVTRDISANMKDAAVAVERVMQSLESIAQSAARIDGASQKLREASRSINA